MSLKDIVDQIKIKDRDKVAKQAQDYFSQVRAWLQEHGEWALVVGVLVGVVFVLFFKLIIVLLVVGGLASYLIWELSSPQSQVLDRSFESEVAAKPAQSKKPNTDSSTVEQNSSK